MPFIFDEDGELIFPMPKNTDDLAVTALPSALPMAEDGDPLLGGAENILRDCDVHPCMFGLDDPAPVRCELDPGNRILFFSLRLMECYLQRN